MLLINRDIVIFFVTFICVYQNTSAMQKAAACSLAEGGTGVWRRKPPDFS